MMFLSHNVRSNKNIPRRLYLVSEYLTQKYIDELNKFILNIN